MVRLRVLILSLVERLLKTILSTFQPCHQTCVSIRPSNDFIGHWLLLINRAGHFFSYLHEDVHSVSTVHNAFVG